jgi:hypothetical protein
MLNHSGEVNLAKLVAGGITLRSLSRFQMLNAAR